MARKKTQFTGSEQGKLTKKGEKLRPEPIVNPLVPSDAVWIDADTFSAVPVAILDLDLSTNEFAVLSYLYLQCGRKWKNPFHNMNAIDFENAIRNFKAAGLIRFAEDCIEFAVLNDDKIIKQFNKNLVIVRGNL